jgi:ferredoxin
VSDALASLTIELDATACCGSGLCAAIAPDAFRLDPLGIAVVCDGAAGSDRTALLKAARNCPTLCISLLDGDREIDLF